jgi:hypothetical protein
VLLGGMYFREKQIGPYRYLYLVESLREGGRTRQRIIKNLGRKEQVEARGDLDRLARSAARMAQRSMILSLLPGEVARAKPATNFPRLRAGRRGWAPLSGGSPTPSWLTASMTDGR